MQQLRWYYLVGLLVLALILVACGEDNAGSEANSQPTEEVPANSSDVSSDAGDEAQFSVPDVNENALDFSLGNEIVAIEPQTVQAGDGTLLINVTMPEGYKFNDLAPFRGDFASDNEGVAFSEEWLHYEEILPTMPLAIPVQFNDGQATVTADLHIYWCEAVNETLCFVDNQILNIPVTIAESADGTVANAVIALTPPE